MNFQKEFLELQKKQRYWKFRVDIAKDSLEKIEECRGKYQGNISSPVVRMWIGVTLYPLFNGHNPDPEYEIGKRANMESYEESCFCIDEATEFYNWTIERYEKKLKEVEAQLSQFTIEKKDGIL